MSSIRSRLLFSLVFGTVAVLLLGGGGLYWLVRHSLIGQYDRVLASRARSISLLVSFEHGRVEFEQDDDLTSSDTDILYSIENLDGEVLRQSSPLGGRAVADSAALDSTLPGSLSLFDFELPGDTDGRALSMVFVPRADAEHKSDRSSPVLPRYIVTVVTSIEPIERALAVLVSALGGIGLAVLGTIVVVLWIGIRSALAPLDRLGAALRRTDASSPDPIPAPPNCPSELRPVYGELDRLIERVRSAMEWERLFADATAHELRTPIAELRTVTEVAERWPDEEDPLRVIHEARSIADEMDRMVQSLLTMARSRSMKVSSSTEATRLAPIAERIVASLEDRAQARGLRLEACFDPDARWHALPAVAELILRNVLENAIEHTPDGGSIDLTVRRAGEGDAELVVRNGPVGLLPEDVELLAKPFWRKDAARTDRNHVGLGLSVVQRMAEAVGLAFTPRLDSDHRILSIRIAPKAASNDRRDDDEGDQA